MPTGALSVFWGRPVPRDGRALLAFGGGPSARRSGMQGAAALD